MPYEGIGLGLILLAAPKAAIALAVFAVTGGLLHIADKGWKDGMADLKDDFKRLKSTFLNATQPANTNIAELNEEKPAAEIRTGNAFMRAFHAGLKSGAPTW